MVAKLRILFLVRSIQVLNRVLKELTSLLALEAVGEIQKLVANPDSSDIGIILIRDNHCVLDDTMGEEPTRESLKTWQARIIKQS